MQNAHEGTFHLSDPVLPLFSLPDLSRGLLVSGSKNRNRAVHGDTVVVELLPKSEWRGKAMALTEGQGDEKSSEDDNGKPMPTGGTAQTDFTEQTVFL